MILSEEHHLPKMAVILHADVVGSTELVQRNETVAHARIHSRFGQLAETIREYGGIAHEIRGDALVAEFSRASDSVCAALAFQSMNSVEREKTYLDIQPKLSIGISLGEVIIADGTVTGAGVVPAQRLEQLAGTNGVVVHGTISDTVPIRFPFVFEDLCDQQLKGFGHSTRVFSALTKIGERVPDPETGKHSGPDNDNKESYDTLGPEDEVKPTIAVLSFDNMSDDLS